MLCSKLVYVAPQVAIKDNCCGFNVPSYYDLQNTWDLLFMCRENMLNLTAALPYVLQIVCQLQLWPCLPVTSNLLLLYLDDTCPRCTVTVQLVTDHEPHVEKKQRPTVVGRVHVDDWWDSRAVRLLTWCDSTDWYLRECSITLAGVKERGEGGVRRKWGH